MLEQQIAQANARVWRIVLSNWHEDDTHYLEYAPAKFLLANC